MFKKILMSGLVLGALAATVGAGSYSAFTDSATASGTVSAGTIDVLVNGANPGVLTFGIANCGNLAPGESCTADAVLTNGSGSLATVITSVTAADNGGGCFNTSVALGSDGGGWPGAIGIGKSETYVVTTQLAPGAGNECQGLTATATVSVSVQNDAADPHNTWR